MPRELRLIVYDRTCIGRSRLGLSSVWSMGRHLYAAVGRSDGSFGARSFEEALDWLTRHRPDGSISQVQFWAHGKWGRLLVGRESFDRSAFAPAHRFHDGLAALRERLAPGALVWFRTCETFGASEGRDFARALTDFFGCAGAGHTFVIGYWQSGLHKLEPGNTPHWPTDEGLIGGSPDRPTRAAWSSPRAPNTITCLTSHVPEGW